MTLIHITCFYYIDIELYHEHDFILNRVLNSHVRQNGLIRKQFLSILLTSFMSSG